MMIIKVIIVIINAMVSDEIKIVPKVMKLWFYKCTCINKIG